MKNYYLLLLLNAFFCTSLWSQLLPNAYFQSLSERSCAFDSTIVEMQYDDWLIYQTLNDKWDGEMDSTKCIGLLDNGTNWVIDLEAIDPEKSVFVKKSDDRSN